VRFYAAVVALLALPCAAQFRETVEVRMLEIEATVLDKDMRPVDTLGPQDFRVSLGGQPTEIASFFLIRRGAVEEPNRDVASTAPLLVVPTRFFIVIDDLHLTPSSKQHALIGLRRFITETMDPWTTATVVSWNGTLSTRVKPTSRREVLLRELEAIGHENPRGASVEGERRAIVRMCRDSAAHCRMAVPEFAESQAADTDRTIDALREVLGTAAGMEGRKVVLFVSEGMATLPGVELFSVAANMPAATIGALKLNRTREVHALAKEAQNAGVVFCTIDPSLSAAVDDTMNDVRIDRHLIRDNARESGRILARETGGRLIADQNDLHTALTGLDQQMSTYYSIGVRAPAGIDDGVKVRVRLADHPDLQVITASRRSLPSREEAVAHAVRSNLYERHDDNPLSARVSVNVVRTDRCVATLEMLVPSEKLTLADNAEIRGQIDVRLAVLDDRDHESEVFRTTVLVTRRHGSVIGQAVPVRLAGDKYVLSMAIIDRSSGLTSYLQRDVDCRH
jgi:VWFA-related protein